MNVPIHTPTGVLIGAMTTLALLQPAAAQSSKSTIIRAQSQQPISEADIARAKPRMPKVSRKSESTTKPSINYAKPNRTSIRKQQ